jgi:aldose 1-epimerase
MTKTIFGVMPTGEAVEKVVLKGGGLTASIITFGAVLQDLRLDGHDAPVVLGFEDLSGYLDHSPYFGATPGRCANRIGDGRFTLDGVDYQLELNEKGVSHLHGGSDGMGRQNWTILEHGTDYVVMEVTDPDGRAGYPGTTRTRATFALKDGGSFSALYETVTDKPTIANVCHHAYFNLDGRPDILGHDLMIAADHYTPVDERLIPTGEIRPVENTAFDFREMRPIRLEVDGEQLGYDHNFCFSSSRVAKRSVALARRRRSPACSSMPAARSLRPFPASKAAATAPLPASAWKPRSGRTPSTIRTSRTRFCARAKCCAKKLTTCFRRRER